MASICFTTVCSSNHYQYFAPVFIYSVKKAYPDAGVKIFLMGKLKDDVRAVLDRLRNERLIQDGWEVTEDCFTSYPMRTSTCNCLRFLLKKDCFDGYDYVLIRDIDFIVLPHAPTHMAYFAQRMKNANTCISCMRGVVGKWNGNYTRIAGGTVLLRNPTWFDKTNEITDKYRHWLKNNEHDDVDNHIAGSYREYDEVMLYRICRASGIKTPKEKYKCVDGKGVSKAYRDVHLGDFNKKRRNFRRICKLIAPESVSGFLKLEQDTVWQEVKTAVSVNKDVRVLLRRARKHIRSR